ncbi:MAG: hypothetical protein AAF721_03685 [Myxococcota bacterium]
MPTPALLVALTVAPACADDSGNATPEGSSSSSEGSGVDGTVPNPTTDPPAGETTASPSDTTSSPDTSTTMSDPATTGDSGSTAAAGSSDSGASSSGSGSGSTSDTSSSGDSGSSGATTGGSTSEGSTSEGSTSEGSTSEGSTSEGSTSEGSSSSGSTSDGSTSTGGSSSEGGSSESTSTGGEVGLEGFETPEVFGDQPTETDLIGDWNLPTDGSAPGYSMRLSIGADGSFVWTEFDAVCAVEREGTGSLWVSGAALVMLFETFTDRAPWDVVGHFGWESNAPFLIRAGYAPVLGHVAVTVTPEMRVALPWASRGYRRTVGGSTGEDVWVAETELWDVVPGDATATIIARDRHTLTVANDDAWHVISHWWYSDGEQTADPTEYYLHAYTDDLAGNLTVGGQPYVYVGGAMASYAPGENFQLGASSSCP